MEARAARFCVRSIILLTLLSLLLPLCGCGPKTGKDGSVSPENQEWVLVRETEDSDGYFTETTYEYNEKGSVIHAEQHKNGKLSLSEDITYDEDEKIVRRHEEYMESSGTLWKDTEYAYDEYGSLASLVTVEGHENREGSRVKSDYLYETEHDSEGREVYQAIYGFGVLEWEVFTTYADCGEVESYEQITYRDDGTSFSDKTVYEYDESGVLIKEDRYDDDELTSSAVYSGDKTLTRRDSYDDGELISTYVYSLNSTYKGSSCYESYEIGSDGVRENWSFYVLDESGSIKSRLDENGSTTTYYYDQNSNLIEKVSCSAAAYFMPERTVSEYDEHGNKIRETHADINEDGSTNRVRRTYEYLNIKTGAVSSGGSVLDVVYIDPEGSALIDPDLSYFLLDQFEESSKANDISEFAGTWYAQDGSIAITVDERTDSLLIVGYDTSNNYFAQRKCSYSGHIRTEGNKLVVDGFELSLQDGVLHVNGLLGLYGFDSDSNTLERACSLRINLDYESDLFEVSESDTISTAYYSISAPEEWSGRVKYSYYPEADSLGYEDEGPWSGYYTSVCLDGSYTQTFSVMATNPGSYEGQGPIYPQGDYVVKHLGTTEGWDVWVCANPSLCSEERLDEYASYVSLSQK